MRIFRRDAQSEPDSEQPVTYSCTGSHICMYADCIRMFKDHFKFRVIFQARQTSTVDFLTQLKYGMFKASGGMGFVVSTWYWLTEEA